MLPTVLWLHTAELEMTSKSNCYPELNNFRLMLLHVACRYTDKMIFTLTDSGESCKIEACSESQVFSVGDFGINCAFAI